MKRSPNHSEMLSVLKLLGLDASWAKLGINIKHTQEASNTKRSEGTVFIKVPFQFVGLMHFMLNKTDFIERSA
jgi:hypothetical protein